MVKIKKQLINSTRFHNGKNNPRKFITLHMTGNRSAGADAQAHANLQSNGNTRDASWHWQVDDKQAIQSFDHKYKLWHASDGQGSGNNESIGIEGCVNSDGDFNKMMNNYVDLVVYIMKQENIKSTDNVVTHYWWSGKNCPTEMFDGKNGWTYEYFISQVNKRKSKNTTTTTTQKPSKKPPAKTTKSVETLANEVIAGKHGTGSARKKSLGKQYNAVQKRVNEKLSGKKAPAKKKSNIDAVAKKVYLGYYGNEPQRSKKLRAEGYDPNAVQKRVNELYY